MELQREDLASAMVLSSQRSSDVGHVSAPSNQHASSSQTLTWRFL
jgi:hypothetical protein